MQTDLDERTDIDSDLDFDAACQTMRAYMFFGREVGRYPCDLPARWVGNKSCCGRVAIACDLHHRSTYPRHCSECGARHIDVLEWRPLSA